MTRDGVVTLEVPVYDRDAIGQYIKTGTESREVFCEIGSITQSEWGAAGHMGLKPEYRVTVWADEYAGAETAVLEGMRYAIYRTYQPSGDKIELYLTRRAGV